MNKRPIIILGSIVLILIVAVALSSVFSGMKPEEEKKEEEKIIRYVKASKIEYTDIESELTETGRVASKSIIDLSPEVRGKILNGGVQLKKGQSFRKGQLLLKIYNQEARLALQAKKSSFLNALANILPDMKMDYPDRYQTWVDFFEAVEINKPLPEMPEIKSAKEKIFLSSRNILGSYYSIKSDEIILSRYYIYAPFNGSYTAVYSEPGAIANPGVRIASMIRTDKLELEVPVEVENVKFMKKGQTVNIISANDQEEFEGKITRISNFVDPQTQSVSVFIDISSKKSANVYQGEYMSVVFSNILLKDAYEIPRNAVFNQNEVFTVVGGKLKKRLVNILKMNDETILINGIDEGTMIVTESLINAVDNMEVEILK
jgi:membrane fusion protein (multidrug efflux system)